jgi:MYXO-CTERM domain-containing protein
MPGIISTPRRVASSRVEGRRDAPGRAIGYNERVKIHVLLATALVLGGAVPARAHQGATVSYAKFTLPADPQITQTPSMTVDVLAPYTIASADTSITITWDDGGIDPTGRFYFYYLDHGPTSGVSADAIEQTLATKIDDPVNNTDGYFISCVCSTDMGVTCPMVTRDPAVNCARRQITWNTTNIPAGTYWIVAVNYDPPFHVYSAANAPIRVAHGGAPLPPAVVWVRPDGFGSWDKSYHLQWTAAGTGPLSFDLAWGDANADTLNAPNVIASGIKPALGSDGNTYSYDWDVSAMPNGNYFLRITVADANGVKTSTDSHFQVSVYHYVGGGGPVDMAMGTPPKKHSGCSTTPGTTPAGGVPTALALLALLGAAAYLLRRVGR